MKKFLSKLLIFIFLILGGSFLLDFIISKGLKQTENYCYQSWNNIIESKINADVLICGNSRGFGHYSPKILDSILKINSYNIGIEGYTFNVQYLRYLLYEKYNKKPKFIIQNVDFATLDQGIISVEREQIFPYVSNSYLRDRLHNYGLSYSEIYLPLHRYFGYPVTIKNGIFEFFKIKHYDRSKAVKGFRPYNTSWDATELHKLTQIKVSMNPETIQLFDKFLTHCRENHIQVILVNSPLYFEAARKMKGLNTLNEIYKDFSKKYNVPYLDYTSDSVCRDTAYFSQAIHLNKKGSELFSIKLANDLKKICFK